jgi:hypothetical protein
LDKIFRLESERTISEDWVVRYQGRFFQLEPGSRNDAPAKGKVVVWKRPDGEMGIEYRIRAVRWREIAAPVRPAVQEKRPAKAPNAGKRKWVPPADHPWREAARWQMERKAARIAKRRS